MNKLKVTRNDLKGCECYKLDHEGFNIIKALGYIPYGYNSGVYGWNYDVYNYQGYILLYGYRVPATLETFDNNFLIDSAF